MLSHYTGGNNGWGTMVSECEVCHEIVAEYRCNELGIPVEKIFDNSESHECDEEDFLNRNSIRF